MFGLPGGAVTSGERTRLFESALRAYRSRGLYRAFEDLQRLIDDGSGDPRHLSYYGLLLATVKGDVQRGLELCESTMESAFYDPQMYLNLARLHMHTSWRSQAVEVLRQGLRYFPEEPSLLEEIHHVSPRFPPLPLLDRDHFLNHFLGKLRAWVAFGIGNLRGRVTYRVRRKKRRRLT